MTLPHTTTLALKHSAYKRAALQQALDDDPELVGADVLERACPSGGTPQNATYQVQAAAAEGGVLRASILAFFEEEPWATGCSAPTMPVSRTADFEMLVDLGSGSVSYEDVRCE